MLETRREEKKKQNTKTSHQNFKNPIDQRKTSQGKKGDREATFDQSRLVCTWMETLL